MRFRLRGFESREGSSGEHSLELHFSPLDMRQELVLTLKSREPIDRAPWKLQQDYMLTPVED